MRTVLGVLLALTACKADKLPATPPAGQGSQAAAPAAAPADPRTIDPAADAQPRCIEGGRVWDGKLQGCQYEVAGCCYDDPALACAAAGCAGEDCQVLESYPAHVLCPDP